MKEALLKIALFPLWLPMLLVVALMYVFIHTEEDDAYLSSKIKEVKE